jgi:hypothetical protein
VATIPPTHGRRAMSSQSFSAFARNRLSAVDPVRDYGQTLPSLGVCLRRVHRPAKYAALNHYLHLIGTDVICLVPFLWRQALHPEKVAWLTTQECYRAVVGRVARAAHFREIIEASVSIEMPPKLDSLVHAMRYQFKKRCFELPANPRKRSDRRTSQSGSRALWWHPDTNIWTSAKASMTVTGMLFSAHLCSREAAASANCSRRGLVLSGSRIGCVVNVTRDTLKTIDTIASWLPAKPDIVVGPNFRGMNCIRS